MFRPSNIRGRVENLDLENNDTSVTEVEILQVYHKMIKKRNSKEFNFKNKDGEISRKL